MTLLGALAFCAFVIAAFLALATLAGTLVILGIMSIGLALLCVAGLGHRVIG